MARETRLAPTGRAVTVPTVHLNGTPVNPDPRKPIRVVHRPNFGGQPCTFATLAEIQHAGHGLCRLDRDQLGAGVRWYVRMGIDATGCAKGGGTPFKRYRDALAAWSRLAEGARRG